MADLEDSAHNSNHKTKTGTVVFIIEFSPYHDNFPTTL